MMVEDPRTVLERLCTERGEDFSSLSRLVGRNNAYIQQYLRRGTPKRLREQERRILARHFGIPETALGAPTSAADSRMIPVARLATQFDGADGTAAPIAFAFEQQWLRDATRADFDELAVIRVEGDSMAPTFGNGDELLIDRGDGMERLRDGVYLLRIDEALVVKRLAINPVGRRVTVQSDSPAYPDWPDLALDAIHCVGRVIWAARRVA